MDASKVFPEQEQQGGGGGNGGPPEIEQIMSGMGQGGGGQQSPTTLDAAGNPSQGADFRQITGAGGSAKRY